ncbi:MAG: hypothetical protein NC548_40210 [Lachnospiraceae bacterium]|nr:hypothetical protein [Lachnospiraceae bacterium]
MKQIKCKSCGKEFPLTRIKCERQTDDPNCRTYNAYVYCPHCKCGFQLEEDADLELSDRQIERLDDIYNAATEFCRVLTEDPELEEDMGFVGEIVDCAVETLVEYLQKPIRYPAIVTTGEKDGVFEQYLEDMVEPIKRQSILEMISDVAGHRIHN